MTPSGPPAPRAGGERWPSDEVTVWAPVPRQYNQFKVSYAGVLEGIAGVSPGRNVRVKPFVTAAASREASLSDGDADGGVDVKIGLGSSLVLDGSYRTDFSQVEADERQINLTRFSLFLPEKREFFLENQGAFQVGPPLPGGQAASAQSSSPPDMVPFFSRRIGLSVAGQPIPIFGGVRLTGKVGRSNLALLDMKSEETQGTRAANFGVARFSQEFLSNSTAGLFYLGRDEQGGSNRVVGADLRLNLRRVADVDALFMRSSTTEVGRGTAWRVGFGYDRNLDKYSISYLSLGERFRDDLGFISRLGVGIFSASGARRLRPKGTNGPVREYRPEVSYVRIVGVGGGLETATLSPGLSIDLADGSTVRVTHWRYRESLAQPFAVRRDYSIATSDYQFNDTEFDVASSRARRVSFTANSRVGGFWGGDRLGYSVGARFRQSAHLAASLTYNGERVELRGTRFTTRLIVLRVDGSFSTRMFLNAFVQYDTDTHQLRSEHPVQLHPSSAE